MLTLEAPTPQNSQKQELFECVWTILTQMFHFYTFSDGIGYRNKTLG